MTCSVLHRILLVETVVALVNDFQFTKIKRFKDHKLFATL